MNLHQLTQIAKAGFPEGVQNLINFDNCKINSASGIHRLYDKDCEFIFMLPKEDFLCVFIGANNFIQITCGNLAFNHYAAIKKMIELKLIKS